MGKPWKWWYQILPQHDGYDAAIDWATVSAECAHTHKTVAGWYATEERVIRGTPRIMTLWKHHPERNVRLRWSKIHRALVRLFRHGEIAWYVHDRTGTLRFESCEDIKPINSTPIVCTGDTPAQTWVQEFSPDTIEERKQDIRWDTLKNMTYANKRKFMGLSGAEKYETKVNPDAHYLPKGVEYNTNEEKRELIRITVCRMREKSKQNTADAIKASTDKRGMCGTWTTEDGGAWVKYINTVEVKSRTHAELIAIIRQGR
jgi:hypothetical protein